MIAADILIVAMRGDAGHPVKVAEDWGARLAATVEVFPSLHRQPTVFDDMKARCRDFLNAVA